MIWYAGRDWPDPRNSRAWRKLRDQVVRDEPICWLRFPGICTTISNTADHIIPFTQRPDLAMDRSNLHGACHPCNTARRNTPVEALNVNPQQAPALDFFKKITPPGN
jgi:5-methylcytosine-specific restriction endonuclease McrA